MAAARLVDPAPRWQFTKLAFVDVADVQASNADGDADCAGHGKWKS
jgi:hypothetical protein